jgi:hypothetical protein
MLFFIISISAQVKVSSPIPPALTPAISVELKASAKYYTGTCPIIVNMTGTIRVTKAVTVNYCFKRSDGVTSRLTQLIFYGAGYKSIPFSWKLSGDYQGWAQLSVKTSGGEFKSGQEIFSVKCNEVKQTNPLILSAPSYQTRTSKSTPLFTGFEKNIEKTEWLINGEISEGSLLLSQMMIILKASQDDERNMDALREAAEELKALAKNTDMQMKRKKSEAAMGRISVSAIEQKRELDNLSNVLASLKRFNFILNKLNDKSGIIQKKRDEYKKMLLYIKYLLKKQ